MEMFKVAEVRDFVNDPTKTGRVKIRIYNENNDQEDIKDHDLPWAVVMQPITSAATNKIGIVPSGLRVGSRVIITYLPQDTSQLYPIVIGSIPRGDLPEDKK